MSEDINALKANAVTRLTTFMNSLDSKHQKIMAYWIQDYVRFLKKESSVDFSKLVRYKRGSIVKAHLGYRIGSEEGGLHYAIVLDVHNDRNSPTATIIPLTSIKPDTDLNHLYRSKVPLGDEVYQALTQKITSVQSDTEQRLNSLEARLSTLNKTTPDSASVDSITQITEKFAELDEIGRQIELCKKNSAFAKKMLNEVAKMKRGSIALVGQITTISKIRIYDPLYPSDILANIRVSDQTLDKLDNKIKELFLKPE